MNGKNTNEPTLESMDDYNGKESPSKRKTINIVIFSLLFIGVLIAFAKFNAQVPSNYVGTPENPGINTSKGLYN